MTTALARKNVSPSRHVYDVTVIGGQLGGALSAALLAKRGLHVLWVPHDGLGAPYVHAGAKLPHAPFLVPPLRSVPVFEEIVQELGMTPTISRAMRLTPLQLLEQHQWYELTHDEKHRGPELARALGDEAEAFDELVRKAQQAAEASDSYFQAKPDLPPEGFFGRWKFNRQRSRFPGLDKDTPLASSTLLRKLLPFVSYTRGSAALTRSRTLGRVLAGPVTFEGGREGLTAMLADRARELGADVLQTDEPVDRLVFEGSTIGVRLRQSDTVYRSGTLIAAMDLEVLTRLVPERNRKAAQKSLAAVTSSHSVVTFNAVLPERGLPRGLGPLSLLDVPSMEGGVILLQVGPGPTPEQRVLSASVLALSGLRTQGEPAVRALATQVNQALARVMPFTRTHVTSDSCAWIDAAPIVEGRAEVHPLFDLPEKACLGITGFLTSSPWKRVSLASRQVLPGLGFEGEVWAALRAVRSVENTLKKNDPLKRKSA